MRTAPTLQLVGLDELSAPPNEEESTLLSALVLESPPSESAVKSGFQSTWTVERASRRIDRLEREVTLLHEAGVKLRYERAELTAERDLLRTKCLTAAMKRREWRVAEVRRNQHNNATWLRRAWAWIGIRLGVQL